MKKIRVLQIVSIMDMGGIEVTLMNYLRNIDHDKFHFDFLVHRENQGVFDAEIRTLGSKIFIAPRLGFKNIYKYSKFMDKFFLHNKYDIVHCHLDSLSFFPLKYAKRNNIQVRIAHSHVNGFDKGFSYPIRTILKYMIPRVASSYCSCSKSAGDFMFPQKDCKIILNPVSIDKFKFDFNTRKRLSSELKLGQRPIIGHVGRFTTAKNHDFILDLAKSDCLKAYDFVLIGDGPLYNTIQEKSKLYNLKNVFFLGLREDVHNYFSLFDYFILPSFYEGLGIVAIEAQINGLPTFVSDFVSEEVLLSESITRLKLSPEEWIDAIHKIKSSRELNINEKLLKYDILDNVVLLQDFYTNLLIG